MTAGKMTQDRTILDKMTIGDKDCAQKCHLYANIFYLQPPLLRWQYHSDAWKSFSFAGFEVGTSAATRQAWSTTAWPRSPTVRCWELVAVAVVVEVVADSFRSSSIHDRLMNFVRCNIDQKDFAFYFNSGSFSSTHFLSLFDRRWKRKFLKLLKLFHSRDTRQQLLPSFLHCRKNERWLLQVFTMIDHSETFKNEQHGGRLELAGLIIEDFWVHSLQLNQSLLTNRRITCSKTSVNYLN